MRTDLPVLRRLLAALGLGLAILVAGGAPATAVDAAESTVVAEAPLAAGQAAVRRRRSPLRTLLRARPARLRRRARRPHAVRLRPAAGHEAPRRAPPTLLI